MIVLGLLLLLFLMSMANCIAEEGLDFYKDPKFWLSLVALLTLVGVAFTRQAAF
jgi:hypothetical protein